MAKKSNDYRLKIVGWDNYPTFLTRRSGFVSYFDGSECPLALSNLLGGAAAEVRFALEDCLNGDAAAATMRVALAKRVPNQERRPKVELLS